MMPLDLVALVSFLRGRWRASSKAKRMMRSQPRRVNSDSCQQTSSAVPSPRRPPTLEYSPSEFSRTIIMSMSPGARPASGQGTPSISRTGRRFTYCSNWRRMGISRPHRLTWSGTVGQPTAPRNTASCPAMRASPSSGIMAPVLS